MLLKAISDSKKQIKIMNTIMIMTTPLIPQTLTNGEIGIQDPITYLPTYLPTYLYIQDTADQPFPLVESQQLGIVHLR